ncbi:MAG: hypothetical protein WCB10_12110 [Steroidobacteraceae bacterium]
MPATVERSPEKLDLVEELAKDARVRRLLPKCGAVKRHLSQRAVNGLDELGAVQVAANGRLLVDREVFVAWLYGQHRQAPGAPAR